MVYIALKIAKTREGGVLMLNNSGVFDYINALGTSLDAAATRNDIINNNIANVNTPNFETELKHAFARAGEETVDARVKNLDLEALAPEIYTDYEELSYRYDGNNVSIQNELAILAKNQTKYNGMMTLLNQNFSQMMSVMK